MKRLREKIALITGAGSGIGRAIAILFAQEGARVSVVDQNPESCTETLRAISSEGETAIVVSADVSQARDAQRMVESTVDAFGGLDMLVNNAGISIVGNVESLTEEQWDRVLDVNLKGVFLASKYAIPHIRRQGGGSILQMASANAIRPFANRDAYSASKGALLALTKGMALGLAKDRIRVNCLCPGTTDTPMLDQVVQQLPPEQRISREAFKARQPLQRIGSPEEIARAALYIVSDEASFMTGSVMVIDGGMSL